MRTAAEFNSGHLAGAMQADWTKQKEFELRASSLDKSKPILVYCQAGGRSAAASNYLATKGFKVTNMIGGMNAWSQASLPIEVAKMILKCGDKSPNESTNQSKGYCLVDCGATWCPPCER
ncbi:MAG: rhodanese-like domain-containing protein [Saprospiraceae bacterium]|nr:rhodanese-like domain-containing protein [Saprospiraceae bacterium]